MMQCWVEAGAGKQGIGWSDNSFKVADELCETDLLERKHVGSGLEVYYVYILTCLHSFQEKGHAYDAIVSSEKLRIVLTHTCGF